MAGRSIAVIGMLRSGKTTMITSLINHWLEYDPNRMQLSKDREIICKWKDEHSEGSRAYQKARQRLIEGRWPNKTLKPMSYHLQLRLNNEIFSRSISLHDIPGERLADVAMIDCKDLSQWSRHIVHVFETDSSTREAFAKFSKLFSEKRQVTEQQLWLEELEQAYREFLAKLIVAEHPLITPSSMLIDKDGNFVPVEFRKDVELLIKWLEESASLGCGDIKIFPIPEALLATAVGKKMKWGFKEYVQKVVLPSLAPLAASEDVIVLTDVAAILENGPTWKNTVLHLYKLIAKIVDPGGFTRRTLQRSWKWISLLSTLGYYAPKATNRIFVVASQADRVHKDDQDRLLKLVTELSRKSFRVLKEDSAVTIVPLTVAAVHSTKSESGHVIQYLRKKDETVEEVAVNVPKLPEEFGDSWKKGEYCFPVCLPRMPAILSNPPKQFGLQLLTEKIL